MKFIKMEKRNICGMRAVKTNPAQWAVLVDFLLAHPELVTHSFMGISGRENYRRLWDEISVQLNSMGYGSKSTDKWIEVFTKWKSKVKVKAQNIMLGIKKTGGGGPLPPLNPVEEKLMGIVGWTAIEGDDSIELGLNTTSTVTEPSENKNFDKENDDRETSVGLQTHIDFTDQCVVEVPALAPLSKVESFHSEHKSLPSTSFQYISAGSTNVEFSNGKKKIEGKGKRKLEVKKPLSTKRRKSVNFQRSRRSDDMTLLRMHQETLGVLNEINGNLSKLATTNQGILEKMSRCPCSSTPNFHDYV